MNTFKYDTTISEADHDPIVRGLIDAYGGDESVRRERLREWSQNWRVVRDADSRVVSGLHAIPMGQFFGGRSVPMVGIASVATPPEHRGTGAASTLMNEMVQELAQEKVAISTLFASTQTLYRKVGYEVSGHRCQWKIPLSVLPIQQSDLTVRRAEEQDRTAIEACYKGFAIVRDGALDRGPFLWSWRGQGDSTQLVIEDAGTIVGYIEPIQVRVPGSSRRRLCLDDCFASTAAAWNRIWRVFASYASMCDTVEIECGPAEPALLDLIEQRSAMTIKEQWMVRVVSVPEAIESRGFRRAVLGSTRLRVHDPLVAGNDQTWRIELNNGRAVAAPTDEPADAEITVSDLAPLYTGFAGAHALVASERLQGSDASIDLLAAAFAGAAPAMGDMF